MLVFVPLLTTGRRGRANVLNIKSGLYSADPGIVIVGVNVTPPLCQYVASRMALLPRTTEPPLIHVAANRYGRVLKVTCRFPRLTDKSQVLDFVCGGWQFYCLISGTFFTELREGTYIYPHSHLARTLTDAYPCELAVDRNTSAAIPGVRALTMGRSVQNVGRITFP